MANQLSTRGTLAFKPPEVCNGATNDTPSSDIWSLGVCLYILLADEFPFVDDFNFDALQPDRFHTTLASASQFNSEVDSDLDKIVARCLAVQPDHRYQSSSALAKDLHQWQLERGFVSTPVHVEETENSRQEGERLAKQAVIVARDATRLEDAADLLTTALKLAPSLRTRYQYRLNQWRTGVSG